MPQYTVTIRTELDMRLRTAWQAARIGGTITYEEFLSELAESEAAKLPSTKIGRHPQPQHQRQRLADSVIDKMCAAYANGEPATKLALQFGRAPCVLYSELRKRGVSIRPTGPRKAGT